MKFIKGIRSPFLDDLTSTQLSRFYMKLLYEFWGFCVNGTNDLVVPGGIPVSGSQFPSGFTTGSNVTLAVGNDGRTVFNSDVFYASANFVTLHAQLTGANKSGLVGKYLVAWQADSTSTDDSIYRITSLLDQTSIRVETHTGATARVNNKSTFRDRSNINWRIVDIGEAANLNGWTSGMGMVMQFTDAMLVNENQLTPQLHLKLITNELSQQELRLTISPSGTWNGSTFTDFTGTVATAIAGPAGSAAGECLCYFLANRDSLITQVKGVDSAMAASSAGFHFEVPKRLFPEQLDPNPIAVMTWGTGSFPTQVDAYATRFSMFGPGSTFGTWALMVRAPFGDLTHSTISAANAGLWTLPVQTRFERVNYNPYVQKYIATDGVLYNPTSGSFCFGRARLRNVMFTATSTPAGLRFGTNWIHTAGGVIWPWDNSVQPFGLFPEGGP